MVHEEYRANMQRKICRMNIHEKVTYMKIAEHALWENCLVQAGGKVGGNDVLIIIYSQCWCGGDGGGDISAGVPIAHG